MPKTTMTEPAVLETTVMAGVGICSARAMSRRNMLSNMLPMAATSSIEMSKESSANTGSGGARPWSHISPMKPALHWHL